MSLFSPMQNDDNSLYYDSDYADNSTIGAPPIAKLSYKYRHLFAHLYKLIYVVIFLLGVLLGTSLNNLPTTNTNDSQDNTPSSHSQKQITSNPPPSSSRYDYIITGSGPSGIILAHYLSSSFPQKKILLLESGTASSASVIPSQSWLPNVHVSILDVPLLWSYVATSSKYLWNIPNARVGRTVGGSGMHNAMMYVRGRPIDFENWPEGWEWSEILKTYKSIETYVSKFKIMDYRGKSGPVITSKPEIADAVGQNWIESCRASGIRIDENGFNDPSAEGRTGCGLYDFNIHNGTRASVAKSFLSENLPSNLHVLTGSTVTRVIFDSKNTATAVEYVNGGDVNVVMLKQGKGDGEGLGSDFRGDVERGVILTAGAIMTPQILRNSGVWEEGDVMKLKGVGKNLQDHPVIGLIYEIDSLNEASAYTISTQLKEFGDMINGQGKDVDYGVLGGPGLSSGGFFKSPYAKENEDSDVQVTVFPRVTEPHVTSFMKNDTAAQPKAKSLITIALLRPDMRSRVVPSPFNSSEAAKEFPLPTINAGSLSDRDVEILKWGLEHVREILSSPPISKVIGNEYSPNKHGDQLKSWIRANVLPNSHWVGSTKMGKRDAVTGEYDDDVVVDERLNVIGVKGLMVADAGIIPNVPNGNVHSTVCVVGRRAGEFIVGEGGGGKRKSKSGSGGRVVTNDNNNA
ncbi:hypothetical protein TrLO_g15978 [Triparma laevis f. longispina]|uniref:Uncharacterized protein n=1 Tax=Triparma laevis f. longispina TaxID=1714387 RepID=A0A9W7CP93_9STRA|nr:hypothetical protein TrLO_g15978 [Triparma laevis f. longispina]